MALHRLEEFDQNYVETFKEDDIKGFGVYTENDEKIGSVTDVLVDEEGRFRYLVVDLGFWIFGKKVLLPVGLSRIDYNSDRVYAVNMTRKQAEDLPEFSDRTLTDFDYEEQVRNVYRAPYVPPLTNNVETAPSVEASLPLDADYPVSTPEAIARQNYNTNSVFNRDSYNYEQEPNLFGINERDHQRIRLYQERLIASKNRYKAGEVAVGKRIETETARVSVPLEKERVVIERITPTDAGKTVAPNQPDFREGEVARIEVYEETPDIQKEAFVREEVKVRKVVDRDTVNAEDTVRREELDIDTKGNPIVERRLDDR